MSLKICTISLKPAEEAIRNVFYSITLFHFLVFIYRIHALSLLQLGESCTAKTNVLA